MTGEVGKSIQRARQGEALFPRAKLPFMPLPYLFPSLRFRFELKIQKTREPHQKNLKNLKNLNPPRKRRGKRRQASRQDDTVD